MTTRNSLRLVLVWLVCVAPSTSRALVDQDVVDAVSWKRGQLAILMDDELGTGGGVAYEPATGRVLLVVQKARACELVGDIPQIVTELRPLTGQRLSMQPPPLREFLGVLISLASPRCSSLRRVCLPERVGCVVLVLRENADGPGVVFLEQSKRLLEAKLLESTLLNTENESQLAAISTAISTAACVRDLRDGNAVEVIGAAGILVRGGRSWSIALASPAALAQCRSLFAPEDAAARIRERPDRLQVIRDESWSPRPGAVEALYRDACLSEERWRSTLRVNPALVFWEKP